MLTLLYFRYTSDEVIETLCFWLRTVYGEGQVVVLEVESNTGKINDWLDTSSLQLLRVTYI